MADPETTRVHLIGKIEENSAKEVLKGIDTADADSNIKRIDLLIVSGGGNLHYALAIYEHILSCPKDINVITEGYCMSGGILVLQAGRKRFSRPHTLFMIHPGSFSWEAQKLDELQLNVEQARKEETLFDSLIARRAGIDLKEYKQIQQPLRFLSPEEARKFGKNGLIDDILQYQPRRNHSKP